MYVKHLVHNLGFLLRGCTWGQAKAPTFPHASLICSFRAGVKDLEVMTQNLITSAFELVRDVEHGVLLLDTFHRLATREVPLPSCFLHPWLSCAFHLFLMSLPDTTRLQSRFFPCPKLPVSLFFPLCPWSPDH